jgi:hypothetical protein
VNGIFHRIFQRFSIELAAIRIELSVPGGFSPGDGFLLESPAEIELLEDQGLGNLMDPWLRIKNDGGHF